MGHIVTNFDSKTWLGIIGIIFFCVIFFKGMGTKEGGAGGSNNGSSSNSSSSNNNTTNTNNSGTN